MAGEFWFQLFSCVAEQEQEQRRRPRIDRSMIGQPTDFRHTGHVGSTDLGSISSLQNQMRGKGGEAVNLQVPHILNARSIHEVQRHSIKAWTRVEDAVLTLTLACLSPILGMGEDDELEIWENMPSIPVISRRTKTVHCSSIKLMFQQKHVCILCTEVFITHEALTFFAHTIQRETYQFASPAHRIHLLYEMFP